MTVSDRYRACRVELNRAKQAYHRHDLVAAFHHLENAHVLGQNRVGLHTLSHWWMLRVGWRQRSPREILSQLLRLPAALLFSRIWVPLGNTGRANVSAIRPMPVRDEIRHLLE